MGNHRSNKVTHKMSIPIHVTVDFIDMIWHNHGPLDEAWYDRIFANCAEHGITRLYWRVALGRAYYRSRIMMPIGREGNTEEGILNFADMLAGCGPTPHDPLERAVTFAHSHGVELYAWFPFNETHTLWPHRNLVDLWYAGRHDLFWCNRDHSRIWHGMPCVAEPEVVARTVAIVEELCDYGVDGVFITPRTHCYHPGAGDRVHASVSNDEFGFNEPIRRRMREQHDVDICRDDFDVELWHRIKGKFYTEFLQACAIAAHQRGRNLSAGSSPMRTRYIPNLPAGVPAQRALQLYHDWEGWVSLAAVDQIVAIQPRLRLAGWDELRLARQWHDINEVTTASGTCPVSVFYPTFAYCNKSGKSWDKNNFQIEPEDMLASKIETFASQGARALLFQELYHALFVDSQGEDTGMGASPKMEYWAAIGRWNRAGAV